MPVTSNETWLSTPPTIQGTASDNYGLSASSAVYISIQNTTDSVFITTGTPDSSGLHAWTLIGWNGTPTNAGVTYTWSFPLSTTTWTANKVYQIIARACGRTGVYSSAYSTATYVYEPFQVSPQRPNSGIISPVNNTYMCSLTQITGTATSNSNDVINHVKWFMKDMTSNLWWSNTNSFDQSGEFPNATSSFSNPQTYSAAWVGTVSNASAQFITGRQYAVYSQATDNASNSEVIYSTVTFIWDVVPPTSSITYPKNNDISGQAPLFYGQYFDANSGIWQSSGAVKIFLQDTTSGKYYYGGQWNTSPAASFDSLDSASIWPSSWTYQCVPPCSPLNGGDQYIIASIAGDSAINPGHLGYPGNYQATVTVGVTSNTFTCATQPPTSFKATQPNNLLQFFSQIPMIAGTASATPIATKVDHVDMELTYNGNQAWNGSSLGDRVLEAPVLLTSIFPQQQSHRAATVYGPILFPAA